MVTSEINELLSCAFCPITSISSHLGKMQVKLILKFKSIPFDYLLTPGRTGKFIPPPWYKGGLMEPPPPPWVFDMLQFFDTILPWVESLGSSSLVYFMGGGAAGGLWCHQTWSPSWPPSWILSRFRNKVKTVRINNFLHLIWKITHK